MTNIGCTKNCVFQKDGLCCYDDTTVVLASTDKAECDNMVCAYQKVKKKGL